MPPHSIGSGTISFGLVTIPIRMYTAASSAAVSFNLLHAKCGSRIRQQTYCPVCKEVVDRTALVKGYEVQKDEYVRFTDEELKGLEGEASKVIDIAEFVPLGKVDPIYFEKTYYLGPDKGGEKAYRLLADAMARTDRVALAKFVMRGKESLVLVRAAQGGLMLHTMYFADEVRDFGEIEKGQTAKIRDGELDLAVRLVDELSHEEFAPAQYEDDHRQRVLAAVEQKVAGQEVTAAGPEPQRAQVIDLMDALKESLARRPAPGKKPPAKVERPAAAAPRRPSASRRRLRPAGSDRPLRGGVSPSREIRAWPSACRRLRRRPRPPARTRPRAPGQPLLRAPRSRRRDLLLGGARPGSRGGMGGGGLLAAARLPVLPRPRSSGSRVRGSSRPASSRRCWARSPRR